jgi:hypothetical protein
VVGGWWLVVVPSAFGKWSDCAGRLDWAKLCVIVRGSRSGVDNKNLSNKAISQKPVDNVI